MAKKLNGQSGIGLTISGMTDAQFQAHTKRVLSKMVDRQAEPGVVAKARERITARRAESLKA